MLVYPIDKNFIVCESLKVIFTWSLVLVLSLCSSESWPLCWSLCSAAYDVILSQKVKICYFCVMTALAI